MRIIKRALLLFSCLVFTACATEIGLRDEFDKSIKSYNRMLRWNEVENAVMTYMDKEFREAFLINAEMFRKRGITLTDFRILTSECLPEKKSGEVIAEFDYFILPSNRMKTTTYRQQWVYKDSINSWKLKSGLPAFD